MKKQIGGTHGPFGFIQGIVQVFLALEAIPSGLQQDSSSLFPM